MASSAAVPTVPATFEYAPILRRIAAYAIDFVILFSALMLVSFTMRVFRAAGLWSPAPSSPEFLWHAMDPGYKLLVILAFALTSGPLYLSLFHSSSWQATFGKRLLNIYVTDDDGQRITFGRALARWFYLWFSWWFLIPALISLSVATISKNHKALHDLPGTLVLRGEPTCAHLESWRVFVAFGVPFVWSVATFLITL